MKQLTKREALNLIEKDGCQPNSIDKFGLKFWALKDSRIIATFSERKYEIYQNKAELDSVLSEFISVSDALYKKNPYGKDLPKYFDTLIDELFNVLGVENRKNKYDKSLLTQMDSLYYAHTQKKEFRDKYLLNIVAFICDFICKKFDVKLEMEISKADHVTWTPVFKAKNRIIGVSGTIAKEFEESSSDDKENFFIACFAVSLLL